MIRYLLSIVIISILLTNETQAQTVLWAENFETGTPGVSINTTDVSSSTTADNTWIINNIYAGGSGAFPCLGFNFPFTVPPAPPQPNGITNSPNSQHLHITPQIAINGGGTLPNASYVTADGVCIMGGTNAFTRMSVDVNTTGLDSVTFDYWWACGGSTLYYGELYYSIDGGNTWTAVLNPNNGTTQWRGETTWINTVISDPIWANQASLRFGFRFVSGTSASGADLDPGYAIDEIEITGYTLCASSSSSITATACDSYTTPSGVVLTNSSVYTDTITNVSGCDSLITINLTIGNGFGTITETACNAYTAPSGQVFTSSGTYTDTITTVGGCDSVITISLQIDLLDTSVTTLGLSLSSNDTTVGTTYQWLDCSTGLAVVGATNQTFTPSFNGNYAVVLMQGSCMDTSACQPVFGVGFQEARLKSDWRLYPNPTSGEVVIDFGQLLSIEAIHISNSLGQVILEMGTVHKQKINFDINEFPNGMYFVKIETSEGIVETIKLLKQY